MKVNRIEKHLFVFFFVKSFFATPQLSVETEYMKVCVCVWTRRVLHCNAVASTSFHFPWSNRCSSTFPFSCSFLLTIFATESIWVDGRIWCYDEYGLSTLDYFTGVEIVRSRGSFFFLVCVQKESREKVKETCIHLLLSLFPVTSHHSSRMGKTGYDTTMHCVSLHHATLAQNKINISDLLIRETTNLPPSCALFLMFVSGCSCKNMQEPRLNENKPVRLYVRSPLISLFIMQMRLGSWVLLTHTRQVYRLSL